MRSFKILFAATAMVATFFSVARAIDSTAPITASNGAIGCATCTTSDANLTDKAVLYGDGGGQAMKGVTINGTTTQKFLTQASNINEGKPQMSLIAETDLPDQTAAELSARTTGVTGDTNLVFSNGPSLTSPTINTGIDLPAGAVNAIAEVADAIKSGGANGSKLGTVTGSFTAGNGLTTDANGNIIDTGGTPGTSIKGIIAVSSETPVAAGSTTVYMSIGGNLSTTEGDVRTPINAATIGDLRCTASGALGGSGVAVTAGDCDGSADYTDNLTVTVVDDTAISDTSDTMSVAAAKCVVLKLVPSSTTAARLINCSMSKS